MFDKLKVLCALPGVSGREHAVREYILKEILGYAECRVDNLGNIIAFKKGRQKRDKKLMLAAHMDEVGLIIHGADDSGFLKFSAVGGIDARVLAGRRMMIYPGKNAEPLPGVIGQKPVHLLESDEKGKAPNIDGLYIDIGAMNKDEALKATPIGSAAVFDGELMSFGENKNFIKAKALDDRAGCLLMIDIIKSEIEFDTWFVFTVQEEVGARGAAAAAFSVAPDIAVIVEATTAADISGVNETESVCNLGGGPVISFMDGRTVYDAELYDRTFEAAEQAGVPCQPKRAVAGGNDAGAIHMSGAGVRVMAVSLPCRYLHSPSCVIYAPDYENTRRLLCELADTL